MRISDWSSDVCSSDLSPPASDGIFHPKIILQLGRETGRAFVSSANATGAGLGGNVEIAIEIESGNEDGPEREILRAIWQYLNSSVSEDASPARYALRWARARAPWLAGPVGAPLQESEERKSDGEGQGWDGRVGPGCGRDIKKKKR